MSATNQDRSRAASFTVKIAAGLALFKGLTWLFTNSAGILGSALDSGLDLLASFLVLWAVLHAERPADAGHPWGHGKVEGLASLFQSLLILAAGLGLAYQVIKRWVTQDATVTLQGVGIGVMVVSTLLTLWLIRRLRRAAKETGSPALLADGAHYTSDILLNLSVILGLGLSLALQGAKWPDLLVGLGISLLILNTARKVFLSGIENLMDRGLSPAEEAVVLRTVSGFAPAGSGFHELRTRRSGADLFLELHLDLSREMSFVDAHDLAEKVGHAIEKAIAHSRVTVHADPS